MDLPEQDSRRDASRPWRLLLVAIAVSGGLTSSAFAAPLHVQSRTQLDVNARRGADGMLISARLRTDTGKPIERANLEVQIPGVHSRTVTTDSQGAFGVRVPVTEAARGTQGTVWQLRFDGDSKHGPAGAAGTFEWARTPTRVDIEVKPDRTTLDGTDVETSVWVREVDGSLGIPNATIEVQFDLGLSRVATTGRNGQVTLSLEPADIGATGRFPVRVIYPGDTLHMPAIGTATMEVLRPTRMNLSVGREGDLETGRYRFSGRLVDDVGPVSGATITLVPEVASAGEEAPVTGPASPVALAVTDARGVFVTAVGTRALAAVFGESVSITAQYAPADDEHIRAMSPSVRISLPGPEGVPFDWYIACTAVLLGLVLLGQTLRAGFWPPYALWRRFSRAVQAPNGKLEESHDSIVVSAATGDGLRGQWVGGTLVDRDTAKGLKNAHFLLSGPDGQERSGVGVLFEEGPLAEGEWCLELKAPGYMSRAMPFAVPHPGHLDGATFGLTSIRAHVRNVFAATVHRLGVPFRWGWDTPTEALARSRSSTTTGHSLTDLKEHVEQIWFSPHPTTSDDAVRAEELAELVTGEEDP